MAFTLIELLLAIAVVGVLAALLLPALTRAYRRAVILACPITYIAGDGTVWVTDPFGNRDLQVSALPAWDGRVRWSPDGKYLAYPGNGGLTVVDPVAEKVKVFRGCDIPFWISQDTVVGTHYFGSHNDLWSINVHTGEAGPWKNLRAENLPCGQITAQYSPYLTDGFVVCEADVLWTPLFDVVLRDHDWNLKRVIWQDDSEDIQDVDAKVDHIGEMIAWSRNRTAGLGEHWYVALKALEDDPDASPALLGAEFDSATFCDWNEHDQMLVIITQKGANQLALMDTQGRVLRTIPTRRGLYNIQAAACWRRYEHF